MQEHEKDQSQRIAQHKLAKEFVELIYGLEAANKAEAEHRQLFNKNLTISDITSSVADASISPSSTETPAFVHPSLNKHAQPLRREDNAPVHITLPRSIIFQKPLGHILWAAGMVSSKAEAHRLIVAGGAYVGSNADAKRGMDDALSFTPARSNHWQEIDKFVIDDKLLILRVGKWRLKIINIIPDEEYVEAGLTCPAWELMKAEGEVEAGGTSQQEEGVEKHHG